MKNSILILAAGSAALLYSACGNAAAPVANSNAAATTNAADRTQRSETVIAHSSENQRPSTSVPADGPKGKWTQSGDPIDTKDFDAAIAAAEKELKAKPADPAAKKALSEAYTKRAVALTDARQYASALGDYRKAVKYDPENSEAKNWIEQIVSIYGTLGKTPPAEGEEPPPLPFKKN
ncbi:MAG: hypothetical protein ACK4S4_07390 [Pyrinomonadaceae bacterium]